jgi:hypothetical protein
MLITTSNLEDFFIQNVKNLPHREDTKAYICNTFCKYKNANEDFSKKILTIEYSEAKFSGNFSKYQNLADWIFFIKSIYPNSLNNASEDYYYSLAQICYYKCYLLINKSWLCFEELADQLPTIIKRLHGEIKPVSMI